MDRHELAWAAGFFDGDGWANASGASGRRTRQPRAQINQGGNDGVPEVLHRFRAAVGVGAVRSPQLKPGRLPLYCWSASSRGDVTATLDRIGPWLGGIKRAQLESALGEARTELAPWLAAAEAELRAWAAGFFDAEGCTCLLKHRSHRGHFVAEMAITQASATGVPGVLERFAEVVGCGRIYGPFEQEGASEPIYRWKAMRRELIEQVVYQLSPWLGEVKRAQAIRVLKILHGQAVLPRGNPAWGSHKTHCVHGHEYASARLRPYRGRGVGIERRPSKQCLVCTRAQARERKQRVIGGPSEPPIISEFAPGYLLK